MRNTLLLDFVLLHYFLKEKKFAVEISKDIAVDYLDPKVQVFYGVMLKHLVDKDVKEVLSLPALMDYCQSGDMEDRTDNFQTIYKKAKDLRLGDEEVADGDFRYYLKRVKSRKNIQIIRDRFMEINGLLDDEPTEPADLNGILKTTLNDINALNKMEVLDEGTVGEDADNMFREYEQLELDPTPFKGVTVGFPSLDKLTNGFQKGELSIVCGMESSGKSLLMMNWGINAWKGSNGPKQEEMCNDGFNVLYFTLEMPRSNKGEYTQGAYLNKRVMCAVSELEFGEIRGGTLSPEDKNHLKETCDWMREYEENHKRFYIVDIPRGARVEDIESKYVEVCEEVDIDFVVIDYLGIMDAGSDSPDHLAQGELAAGLHEFARAYNIPVLTAAQLNRPQGGKGQSLDKQSYNNTRLARGAGIGHHANNVFMIATRDDEQLKMDMELHITKFRDGAKGKLIFTKAFNKMKVYDGSPLSSSDPELEIFESIEGNDD